MPKIKSKKLGYSHSKEKSSPAAAASSYSTNNRAFAPLFNKDLGQHILKNPLISQGIVDKARKLKPDYVGLKPTDTVFEVGPGTGNLTMRILEKAKNVIAVELDPRLAAELAKRVQGKPEQKRLEIMIGDVIKMELPYFDVCISNTPFQISSPLIFKLLEHRPLFRCAVLMFQREFALRLIAKPGDSLYCRLSVNAQFFSKINHIMKVGKNNFKPPPKVEASVVLIEPRNPPPTVDFKEWDGLVRIAFVRKNKTLAANFKTSSILQIIENNYKTFCAANDLVVENPLDIKKKVLDVLDSVQMAEARGSKIDLDGFLKYMISFKLPLKFSFMLTENLLTP
ncbi:hypothetical protein G9A89_017038 [Geosiphon pyriformis]|nr:hypothetical protein G9A89_017038 [Geosiphon pyriformis]